MATYEDVLRDGFDAGWNAYIKAHNVRAEIAAADVQEVVRCKDWHKPFCVGDDYDGSVESPDELCHCVCGEDQYYSYVLDDDFFRAKGKRKNEEAAE